MRETFDSSKAGGAEVDPSLEALARQVIGACINVHRAIGPGFAESVYENALALELERQSIRFERQVLMEIRYLDQVVGTGRADMVAEGRLVLELKSVEALLPLHMAQTLSYLRIMKQRLGLLINFNAPILKDGVRRVIL
jgi:GxxExxY protein